MYTQAQLGKGDCHDAVTACLIKSLDKYSVVADALDALTPPTSLTQLDTHVKSFAQYIRQFANDSKLGLQNGDADLLFKAVADKDQADSELATIKTMLK
jgi:hypothetical protein